jgi:hypothetical protein
MRRFYPSYAIIGFLFLALGSASCDFSDNSVRPPPTIACHTNADCPAGGEPALLTKFKIQIWADSFSTTSVTVD